MAGMKEIRGHIESIKSTQKVTNAMYLIASTKMRRAKEDLEKTRPFFDALTGEIERIFQRGGEIRSPYVFCGVCVTKCPTRAWTRSEKKYYRLTLMGRTGKKNPRLGEDFLIWADEDTIIKVILNTYKFVKEYIDPNAPGGKEHVGYIIDRVGFAEYKKWALDGVELPPETIVKNNIYWSGIHYR